MKYCERIAQAEDGNAAIKIVQEAMNEVGERMTELFNEFSGRDLVFVVAAMMLMQPQLERTLGPEGCEIARNLARESICVVAEKKKRKRIDPERG